MANFHELKIGAIKAETSSAVSINFDVPETLNKDYQFAAGQYLNLSAIISGKEVRRAYSICSAPSSGSLTVLVKKVEQGVFSTFANEELSDGDLLKVATSRGKWKRRAVSIFCCWKRYYSDYVNDRRSFREAAKCKNGAGLWKSQCGRDHL